MPRKTGRTKVGYIIMYQLKNHQETATAQRNCAASGSARIASGYCVFQKSHLCSTSTSTEYRTQIKCGINLPRLRRIDELIRLGFGFGATPRSLGKSHTFRPLSYLIAMRIPIMLLHILLAIVLISLWSPHSKRLGKLHFIYPLLLN
jgi:hypothetical protein